MANTVILSQDEMSHIICVVDLKRTKATWASLAVNYQDRGLHLSTPFGWTGHTIPATGHVKALLRQRPDVYAHVAGVVDGRSVMDVVNAARCKCCHSFRVGQLLPRPAIQYAPLDGFGDFILEPATFMRADPWLNFRIIGPGKTKRRRFFGSWNGSKITGRDWYEFQRLHPNAADHVRWIFGRTTPTELSAFAHWAELQERIAA